MDKELNAREGKPVLMLLDPEPSVVSWCYCVKNLWQHTDTPRHCLGSSGLILFLCCSRREMGEFVVCLSSSVRTMIVTLGLMTAKEAGESF